MGNKESLDFSKDLDRTLGTAEDAPKDLNQALPQSEASLSFAEAMSALVNEALRLGYTRTEITLALGDAIGKLGQTTDDAQNDRSG